MACEQDVCVRATGIGGDVPQARISIHIVTQGSAVLGIGNTAREFVDANGITTEVLGVGGRVERGPVIKNGGVDEGGGSGGLGLGLVDHEIEAIVAVVGANGRGHSMDIGSKAKED